jgi:hypothetical protein
VKQRDQAAYDHHARDEEGPTAPHLRLGAPEAVREALQLTRDEEEKAIAVMLEAVHGLDLPEEKWCPTAWCLAVDHVRRGKAGRPRKNWPLYSRLLLVTAVERQLHRLPRSKKTIELESVLGALKDDPRWKGRGDLKNTYYDTKRDYWVGIQAIATARGFSLLDDDVSFSIGAISEKSI